MAEGLDVEIEAGGAGGEAVADEAAPGGAPPTEPANVIASDDYVGNVSVGVHESVNTLLVVEWTQTEAADETWLDFSFEEGKVMQSRPKPGELGPHEDVVLGVPETTDVAVRVVSSKDGVEYVSSDYQGTTGPLPSRMPRPEVLGYDPERASPERFLFGSVEDSAGGRYAGYYASTFWLYIMDRKGRVVWYYADPASNATSSFQRVARDGEYLWIERRRFNGEGAPSVLKTTLDARYSEEIPVPGLSDCIDVTDDGSLLYDVNGELREMTPDRSVRTLFSCRDHFGPNFFCYSNTVNYDASSDTVFLSFPYQNTVVQIERQAGRPVAQFGSARGSWSFAAPSTSPPEAWAFSFQHFPNLSPAGTLMVSTHSPGCRSDSTPGPQRHAFVEFEVDRANRELVERWRYVSGAEWPRAKGMAIRLSNGNTLANYGTGGVIREITPDKRTVFHVKFDVSQGSDFYNKMVGHNVLIDDLYALNGGGPAGG
jgi:hypothetical protein